MLLNKLFCLVDEFDNTLCIIIRNLYYKKKFVYYGKNIKIGRPLMIVHPNRVSIGNNVTIHSNIRMEAIEKWRNQNFKPEITIEDNVSIEQNVHIACAKKVLIGKGVVISSNVFISDLEHDYADYKKPIMSQKLIVDATEIKENSFIGSGARILSGVTIGKHCIIGANSVVTKDIPDYCVAAGVPAKIIKKFNLKCKRWEKVLNDKEL